MALPNTPDPNCFFQTLSFNGVECISRQFCMNPSTFCFHNMTNLSFDEPSCHDETLSFSEKVCVNTTRCFTTATSTAEKLCANRYLSPAEIVAVVVACVIGVLIVALFITVGKDAIGAYNNAVIINREEMDEKMKEWRVEREKEKEKARKEAILQAERERLEEENAETHAHI